MNDLKRRIELLIGHYNPEQHLSKAPDFLIIDDFNKDSVHFKKILIEVDSDDRVPAFLLYANDDIKNKPGILALHQTTQDPKTGAKEPAGLAGHNNYHYGLELAKLGFVVIIPEYPFFGSYSPSLHKVYNEYGYESMTMKGIMNHTAALNILCSLSFVDNSLIGCIGHSLGGTNTLFISYFDRRIKCAAVSAGFTTFEAYAKHAKSHDLSKWSLKEKYMPNTRLKFKNNPKLMPFDFDELITSLCKVPLFMSTPKKDEIFDIDGARSCIAKAKTNCESFNSITDFVHIEPNTVHDFPEKAREKAYKFLINHLKN